MSFPKMNCVYVDNAATTQKPTQVIERITQFYEKENANIHRGMYPLSEKATKVYEDAREKVATYINAKKNEVVFTKGATHGLNIIAHGLGKLGKKKVALPLCNHHANIVPWKEAGFDIVWLPLTDDFELDMEVAEKKIKDVDVVAFSSMSNAIGTKIPQALITLAREKDIVVVVDAAQSIAHEKIDVQAMDCDFLVFSGHKMYGPTGIGVMYGKEAWLKKIPPFETGGDMVLLVTKNTVEFQEAPRKFEAGTPPIAQAVGLGEAVEFMKTVDFAKEEELRAYCLKQLEDLPYVTLFTPKQGGPIISFTLDDAHNHDVAAMLGEQGICVRGGHHCSMPLMEMLHVPGTTRISFACYNTKKDVDAVVAGIKKVREAYE